MQFFFKSYAAGFWVSDSSPPVPQPRLNTTDIQLTVKLLHLPAALTSNLHIQYRWQYTLYGAQNVYSEFLQKGKTYPIKLPSQKPLKLYCQSYLLSLSEQIIINTILKLMTNIVFFSFLFFFCSWCYFSIYLFL